MKTPTAGPGDTWGSPEDDPEDEWQDLSDSELSERRELAAQDRIDNREAELLLAPQSDAGSGLLCGATSVRLGGEQ